MPTLHRIFGCLRLLFSWLFNNFRGIQKKRETCICQFHILRPSHCPKYLNRQREAHAEYKILSCYATVKVRVCAYVYAQKTYQIGTRGIFYIP